MGQRSALCLKIIYIFYRCEVLILKLPLFAQTKKATQLSTQIFFVGLLSVECDDVT
jgi:hypothetical protein